MYQVRVWDSFWNDWACAPMAYDGKPAALSVGAALAEELRGEPTLVVELYHCGTCIGYYEEDGTFAYEF